MRRPDVLRIDSEQGGDFAIVVDRCSTYELTQSFLEPSEFRFELGDEGTWSALKDATKIGTRFQVFVNDRPRLKGRLLARRLPVSADRGSTMQASVRTRLADADFTTADPKLNLRRTTLKDVVLGAYKQLGLTESDFIFRADLARNVLTGKGSTGKAPVDLAELKEDAAKVHPPETIRGFVERHLARFHLTHWDGPKGEIVVGAPDDEQAPMYQFRCRRQLPASLGNNILDAEKCEDYEQVPAGLWVFGVGGGRDLAKAKVQAVEVDEVLQAVEPPLTRNAVVIDEGVKTQAQAEARARREMSLRSLMKDAWRIRVDGFTHWNGSEQIPYAIDTVADVQIETGPKPGPYLVHRVTLRGNPDQGQEAELEVVGKGVWKL